MTKTLIDLFLYIVIIALVTFSVVLSIQGDMVTAIYFLLLAIFDLLILEL